MKDMTLNFEGRDQYLAWRAEWKANYREVTLTIRNLKEAHKIQQRAVSKAYLVGLSSYQVKMQSAVTQLLEHKPELLIRYRSTEEKFTGKHGFWPWTEMQRWSGRAAHLMGCLEAAKKEAQRQWEATHPELVEASRERCEKDQAAKAERVEKKIAAGKTNREAARAKFRQEQTSAA